MPVSLSPPVTDLIVTTCDFQKDLLDWNISPVNDGFDAKALFNMYITKRINDKHLELLESCKLYKNRMLVSLSDQIKETIALAFENYKSLDESSPSGDTTIKSGSISPAIDPALKLYSLLHDMIKSTVDQSSYTIGYLKMKSLVINIRNEIVSDIEMHDKQVLHYTPCLATCFNTSQLSNRMRTFLAACPPVSLSPPVTDLIVTTCDFQKDLLDWNIRRVRESGSGDRVDRPTRSLFGLAGKIPPEKFSGGGEWWPAVGRLAGEERSPKPVLLSLKHAQLPVLGSTRMYRDLRLPTSGPEFELSQKYLFRRYVFISFKGELHYLLDKVVSVRTAPGPNNSDHNINTITNGDGILHSVC
ncbi:hypothetical protein Tco_1316610 [Tanacetum coccineum]